MRQFREAAGPLVFGDSSAFPDHVVCVASEMGIFPERNCPLKKHSNPKLGRGLVASTGSRGLLHQPAKKGDRTSNPVHFRVHPSRESTPSAKFTRLTDARLRLALFSRSSPTSAPAVNENITLVVPDPASGQLEA